MLNIKLSGKKKGLGRLARLITAVKIGEDIVLNKAGDKLVKEMKRTITDDTENWPALSPATVRIKGHDKKLVDKEIMLNSIEWRHSDNDTITVGVHSDAPEDRALIALKHEYGAPEANLPARPFLYPTWDREKNGIMRFFELKE